ncbi:hypothetical protein NMG60_11030139, partial [Bertholletia excelsa]
KVFAPGDMGWPFLGNMWSFLRAFKSGHPDDFISSFASRFGPTHVYKAFMFGSPCAILTSSESCRRALTDDDQFGPGWPVSVTSLLGKKGLHGVSRRQHKRLRRLVAAAISGDTALAVYLDYIKQIVATSLEKWAGWNRPMEFLTEMRKLAFRVIMYIVMSRESDPIMEVLEREYTILSQGIKATAIDLPGFAYHRALKAREKMVRIFQGVVDERRAIKESKRERVKKDMLDLLLEAEDEDGGKLKDEEVIDLIIIFLTAGHESSAHAIMWAVIFLTDHPHCLHKAKEEQEEIIRRRSSTGVGLSFKEIKQMKYLSKAIDETLRLANISFALFREAKTDINLNGYIIPKGWKVLAWIRSVHMDPQNYNNPREFDPSRWDDHIPRAGTYIPFGAGNRLCPGLDLAKLEISVFLHYFLLHYKLERLNPGCRIRHIPIIRPVDNCLARIKKLSSSTN